MRQVLKAYAESFCRSLGVRTFDDFQQVTKPVISGNNARAICGKIGSAAGVTEAILETEWDNVFCQVIQVTLDKGMSANVDLGLRIRLSKMANIACAHWSATRTIIGIVEPGKEVKVGQRYVGPVSKKARNVQRGVFDALHLSGYLVIPESTLRFSLECISADSRVGTICGAAFFFGSDFLMRPRSES
jgi:hypothetical protein